jgi:hypothetical protein
MQTRTAHTRSTRAALIGVLALLGVLGSQETALAQVYQPYWTARPVDTDSPALGGAVGFGDDMFRFAGHARFNISSASDLGLELVFDSFDSDFDDDTHYYGGGLDFKYLAVAQGERLPFALATQACVGMEWGNDTSQLVVPFGFLGSKSIAMDEDDGRMLTPFASAYVVIEHTSFDAAGVDDDTDVNVEIRLGAAFEVATRTNVYAALHIGNGTMFFLGFSAGL